MQLSKRKTIEEIAELAKETDFSELRNRLVMNQAPLVLALKQALKSGMLTQDTLERHLKDPHRFDYPEHPDLQLEALLCCNNHEYKPITTLFLARGARRRDDFNTMLAEFTISGPINEKKLVGYISQFAEYGFAEHDKRSHTFNLTPDGHKYLVPVAAYTLLTSADIKTSMYALLRSATFRSDKSTPYYTYFIMDYIRKYYKKRNRAGTLTINELSNAIDMKETNVLKILKKLEILKCVSVKTMADGNTHTWIGEESYDSTLKKIQQQKSQARKIADYIMDHGPATTAQIAEKLNIDPRYVKVRLAKLRSLKLVTSDFTGDTKSSVHYKSKAKPFLTYFDTIKTALYDTNKLRWMNNRYHVLVSNIPQLTRVLHAGRDLYRPFSYHTKIDSRELQENLIAAIMQHNATHDIGPTQKQIKTSLDIINSGTILRMTSRLLEENILTRETVNKQYRYYCA
ncbi:MAG: hypothetical protein ABIC04_00125 [Nanoarchaeota archaeon]